MEMVLYPPPKILRWEDSRATRHLRDDRGFKD